MFYKEICLSGDGVEFMSVDTILKFDHVTRIFGEDAAVNEMSFEVKSGEFVAILGQSGCGKTTTLRMIAGLERCSSGEISFQGKVLDNPDRKVFIPPNKRDMGMVFQSYAIWPHMTVFENVAYPLKVRSYKKSKIKEEVERVLELVGLSHVADRKATQLSGGQQQRVALARSLVFHPKLLLLDEPFSNLDAKLREQMRIEIKTLQKRLGLMVILVTHDQVEALSLADKIIMMNKGRKDQVGSPKELYEKPNTVFVRDFLGSTLKLRVRVNAVRDNGMIEVQQENEIGGYFETSDHHLVVPKVGDECFMAVRAEYINILPAENQMSEGNHSELQFHAQIEKLLFIGDQYESIIKMRNGDEHHLFLPKSNEWYEGQEIVLGVKRGITIWPN
jgi:ABC-type Fe3+/spermidine/putrescine transport system ATPase subunit